jgi:hypothetical protein
MDSGSKYVEEAVTNPANVSASAYRLTDVLICQKKTKLLYKYQNNLQQILYLTEFQNISIRKRNKQIHINQSL